MAMLSHVFLVVNRRPQQREMNFFRLLAHVLENEASSYNEEGIPWKPIAYKDNKDIIELCEGRAAHVGP